MNMYTIAVIFSVMLYSFGNNTQGILLSNYAEYYHLTSLSQGAISAFQSLGMILAMLFLLFGKGKLSKSRLLMLGLAAVAVSFGALYLAPPFFVFLVCYFCIGAAYGNIDSVSSSLMADMHSGRHASRYMGVLHSAIGIGGMIGPLFIQFLLGKKVAWNCILGIFSFIALAVFLLNATSYCKAKAKLPVQNVHGSSLNMSDIKKFLTPQNLFILFSVAFYGAHQICIVFWIARFVKLTFGSERLGAFAVSLFWVGTVISRFTVPFLPMKTENYISRAMLITTAVLGASVLARSAYEMCAVMFAAGLIGGAVIPMGLHDLCKKFSRNTLLVSAMVLLSVYGMQMISSLLTGAIGSSDTLWTVIAIAMAFGLISSSCAYGYRIKMDRAKK